MEFNIFIFFKRNQHYIPLLKLFTFIYIYDLQKKIFTTIKTV